MPSNASAEDLIRIGRSQIDISNFRGTNTVPRSNRPELAATGVRNQIQGKIERNRADADNVTGIAALTESILAAAEGQPLDTSISAQQESQANAKLLLQFLIGQQQQQAEDQKGMSSGSKTPESRPQKGVSADSPKNARGLSDVDIEQLLQLLLRESEVESKKMGAKGGK